MMCVGDLFNTGTLFYTGTLVYTSTGVDEVRQLVVAGRGKI